MLYHLMSVEGRDKFCKMIQYASRFIKYNAQGKNENVHKAFDGLFSKFDYFVTEPLLLLFTIANMGTARKLFRLFKSFNEYVKI